MRKECTRSLSIKKGILLDTNAYLRLADNLHPLLSRTFGTDPVFELKILGGTIGEYNYQSRLKSKFDWVMSGRHVDDRRRGVLRLNSMGEEAVNDIWQFILSESHERAPYCSRFDIRCLATAYELGLTLVTDDRPLRLLAKDYEVECLSTLGLLSLMKKHQHVDMEQIQGTVHLWRFNDDLPGNFYAEFLSLFGVAPEI